MKDYRELANRYRIEAEAYALFQEERTNVYRAFIVFAGVITQMESDSVLYLRKHGKNEKIQPLLDRIEILKSLYEDFSGLDEKYQRLRLMLDNNNKRMFEMEGEIEKYRKQEAWTKE